MGLKSVPIEDKIIRSKTKYYNQNNYFCVLPDGA